MIQGPNGPNDLLWSKCSIWPIMVQMVHMIYYGPNGPYDFFGLNGPYDLLWSKWSIWPIMVQLVHMAYYGPNGPYDLLGSKWSIWSIRAQMVHMIYYGPNGPYDILWSKWPTALDGMVHKISAEPSWTKIIVFYANGQKQLGFQFWSIGGRWYLYEVVLAWGGETSYDNKATKGWRLTF